MEQKYKTIKISEEFHTLLKVYCEEKGLKLNKYCEMLIRDGFLYAKEYSKLENTPKGCGKILLTDSPTSKEESV